MINQQLLKNMLKLPMQILLALIRALMLLSLTSVSIMMGVSVVFISFSMFLSGFVKTTQQVWNPQPFQHGHASPLRKPLRLLPYAHSLTLSLPYPLASQRRSRDPTVSSASRS